jgi:hypothetical protein
MEGIKEETSGIKTERTIFSMRKDLFRRLNELCTHKGDRTYYINQAIETWLNQNEQKVIKFNEKIKE